MALFYYSLNRLWKSWRWLEAVCPYNQRRFGGSLCRASLGLKSTTGESAGHQHWRGNCSDPLVLCIMVRKMCPLVHWCWSQPKTQIRTSWHQMHPTLAISLNIQKGSITICHSYQAQSSLQRTRCIFMNIHETIADVAVRKCHQRQGEILIFFTHTTESSKFFFCCGAHAKIDDNVGHG